MMLYNKTVYKINNLAEQVETLELSRLWRKELNHTNNNYYKTI